MGFDRRSFMIGGGAVAGAAMLSGMLDVGKARAAAPKAKDQAPAFYRTKVGAIEVTSFLDGGMSLPDSLLIGADAQEAAQARARNFLPEGDVFPAYVNAFMINTGDRITLVDTGARGMGPSLGRLLSQMEAAGVKPSQVDDIILTHAHPDHAGGLVDEGEALIFPKARLRLSAEELTFWTNAENAAKFPDRKEMFESVRRNILPYQARGQVEVFTLGADLGKGLSSVALPGHTPGHSGVRVSDGKDQLVIWADIVHVPAVQFENPQVGIGFDLDPAQARTTRQKIMEELGADKVRLAGSHLCFPAIGHVARRNTGYDFIPQQWEPDLA